MTDWPDDEHWIERHNEVTREIVWRSHTYGTEYIAATPQFELDEPIGHRDTITTRGRILGSYPEVGTVAYGSNDAIVTHVEHATVNPIVYTATR